MTATFVQRGDAIDYTPSVDVAASDVVVQGDLIGIAKRDIAANALGALHVVGIYDISKAVGAGTAITVGSLVYYDAAEKVAKTDDESGANKLLGKTVLAAADNDATVRVRLSQ